MARARPWTAAEDELLRTLSPREAAGRTGRTLSAVYHRRLRLGVAVRTPMWTAIEDALIMKMPAARAAAYLHRSLESVHQRRRHLGLIDRP
jgi:hypothetical protein